MCVCVRSNSIKLNQHLSLPLSIPPSLTPQVLAPSLLKLYLCSSFSCMIMGYCATLNSGQPAIWPGRGALTCNANSGRSTPEEMCPCRKRWRSRLLYPQCNYQHRSKKYIVDKKSLAGQVAKLAKSFSRKFQLYSTTHMHVHVHVPVHYIVAVITLYCALVYFRRARGCFRPLPLGIGNPTLNKGFLP